MLMTAAGLPKLHGCQIVNSYNANLQNDLPRLEPLDAAARVIETPLTAKLEKPEIRGQGIVGSWRTSGRLPLQVAFGTAHAQS